MDDLLSIAVSNAVAATILALAALAVGAVYRRPALVHGMWLLVLLKLVTPPLVFLPIAWPAAAESPPEVAAVREEPPITLLGGSRSARPTLPDSLIAPPAGEVEPAEVEALLTVEEPPRPSPAPPPNAPLWPQMLRIGWGVGALLWFLLAMERLHRFRRLLRFARPAPTSLQERARRLADSLGLRRCPRVRLLPGRVAPMLWAIGGPPCLLVPANLLDVLSDEQLDTLLLHELAHLRRRDHWVRVLEFVVMGLYWWHPVVWYARRELREAEEQCCDAWVVSTLPGKGRTYASALLDTLDFLSTAQVVVPPLASGLSQIADLKRRLTMIMQGNTPRSLTWPGCLAVVALGLTLLPMMPSLHGQAPAKEQENEAMQRLKEAEQRLRQVEAQLEVDAARAKVERATLELYKKKAAEELNKAKAAVEKKATYRIEITLPADGSVNQKEIIEKIRKALPERLRGSVVLRLVPEIPNSRRVIIGQAGPSIAIDVTRPAQTRAPTVNFTRPAGPSSETHAPPSKSSEKRINELEKKLEKVIHELHELRKQLGNTPRPAAPEAPGSLPSSDGFQPPPTGSVPAPSNPFRANGSQDRFRPLTKPQAGNNKPSPTPPQK